MKRLEIQDKAGYRAAADYITARSAPDETDVGIREKMEAAKQIVEAVRLRGDDAVAEFTARFDGVRLDPSQFEVTQEEMDAALASVDPQLLAVLERAHANIRRFHSRNLRESWQETFEDGTVLGQRITPVDSAGVYAPGGKAFYPSSVLMNIVPARVAGVKEIVLVSPPTYDGSIHPAMLAAARIAGATRVFRVGGAQAIAALAYGTQHIPAVTKITGPGNVFVTAAKALVRHVVEIDSEAGPSEVVVIADGRANPAYVAAEMLAQAEHDEDAAAVLITPDAGLADAVEAQLEEDIAKLSRNAIIRTSLEKQGCIIVTRSLDEAVELADLFAPEHLSIQVEYPMRLVEHIGNAGAIMVGDMTPVAAGDYYAGPNHILPTGRRARFSSPLSAEDFRKVSSVLYYTRDRLRKDADDIRAFAGAEGLDAHARAVEVRTS